MLSMNIHKKRDFCQMFTLVKKGRVSTCCWLQRGRDNRKTQMNDIQEITGQFSNVCTPEGNTGFEKRSII